jgi:queuine tRNA-ribosyltransferase
MVDRTHAFTRDALEQLYGSSVAEDKKSKTAYFAPVLPLDNAQQSLYLEDLESEFRDHLSGLALYESTSLSFIPENIGNLPRLLLSEPPTPHEILRDISLGADILTVPFIGTCSDAGIALDFTFPAPSSTQESREPQPLGIDLWSSEYAKDTSPFRQGCECYACRHHHRAYLNHLLAAKEMTAWVLLQLHNHHVMDQFFARIRDSIQRGTFEEDVHVFNRVYATALPNRTGEGPRYVLCCLLYPSPRTNQLF